MAELSFKLQDMIHDLWGMGLTVVPRESGQKLFDAATPPAGMAYQWMDRPEKPGWSPVQHGRHPGLFAPYGTNGDIQHQGLWLMETTKARVEAAHAETHRKAQKNVDDWFARNSAAGITGSVTVLSESSKGPQSAEVRELAGSGSLRTKIPPELFPHMSELLRERDRMVAEALKVSIEVPQPELKEMHLASLRASCLQIAIDIIRKKYEDTNGTTAESDDTGERNGDAAGTEATGTPAEATSDS